MESTAVLLSLKFIYLFSKSLHNTSPTRPLIYVSLTVTKRKDIKVVHY